MAARRRAGTRRQHLGVKGFLEVERKAFFHHFAFQRIVRETAGDEKHGLSAACFVVPLFYRQRVQARHERIQQHGIRLFRRKGRQRLRTVLFTHCHRDVLRRQRLGAQPGKLRG